MGDQQQQQEERQRCPNFRDIHRYYCEYCDRNFHNKNLLEYHLRDKHKKKIEKRSEGGGRGGEGQNGKHTCEEGVASFKIPAHREKHMITHPFVELSSTPKLIMPNAKRKTVYVDDELQIVILDVNDNENTEERRRVGPPVEEYVEAMIKNMNANHYIDAALRSSHTNEVFIFCHYHYVVLTYDPTSPGKDQVVKGPLLLCDGFPTLYSFQRSGGVDAAFGCHGVNQAFLFGGTLCVKIEYGPVKRMGNAIGSPNSIGRVFPCLRSIGFLIIDAAFESTVIDEAYLFQGSKYALLNYTHKTLVHTGLITDEFPCLLNTKFASDITAAFASHLPNQAYLFKDDNSYVLIHYTPGMPDRSYIISDPAEIVPSNWPSLQGIVPFKKRHNGVVYPKTWTPTIDLSVPFTNVHHNDYDDGTYTYALETPPRISI